MTMFSSAAAVRAHMVDALEADLIGPYDADKLPHEVLGQAPSRWYLTGFLVPQDAAAIDDPDDEPQHGASDDDHADDGDEEDTEPRRRRFFASAIGMSALIPDAFDEGAFEIDVSWADYQPSDTDATQGRDAGTARAEWTRIPRREHLTIAFDQPDFWHAGVAIPDSGGLLVRGVRRRLSSEVCKRLHVADGAQAVSVFLVNARPPAEPRVDAAYAFQAQLAIRSSSGWIAREDVSDTNDETNDPKILDLQFRETRSWASGHGVGVDASDVQGATLEAHSTSTRRDRLGFGWLRTTWLPTATVQRIAPREANQLTREGDKEGAALGLRVTVSMATLASATTSDAIHACLDDLPAAYERWIHYQAERTDITGLGRLETRHVLVTQMQDACGAIKAGIDLLADDAEVREAFCMANQAMHDQTKRPGSEATWEPAWRLFQLAFILLALPSTLNASHAARKHVELIYFPTGGGKTEAYLGLIATSLVYRRLRYRDTDHGGLGVAVMLRYTLRLLTLDQLERAAALICALERLRRQDPARLGSARFAIGLWVGRAATVNRVKDIDKPWRAYKRAQGPSPIPVSACPWCGGELELKPSPNASPPTVAIGCKGSMKGACEFSPSSGGLPLVFIDELIYRELPCFLVATVDKFALLPWRAEVGKLFGSATARRDVGDAAQFYGADETATAGSPLPDRLRPPDLVVQDELHLISGPLGSMVGLYETAVQALASGMENGNRIEPKIVASTATVRNAQSQVQRLYGRRGLRLFPPAGVDDGDRFFAMRDTSDDGRRYLGVSAPGRSMQRVLARVYTSLLASSEVTFDASLRGEPGADQVADGYRTLLGYFNALRDLGSMRRVVEDQVLTTVAVATERKPRNAGDGHRWYKDRELQYELLELTSRESSGRVKEAKRRLAQPAIDKDRVDVALASNMISVGLDITRLALMVVAGAPKSTSEYIQASSRVGRSASRPGLVVTVYNAHRARDRSQYEQFETFHNAFYRHVEATSVTPFAPPAIDRGLGGLVVALARHGLQGRYASAHAVRDACLDPEVRDYVRSVLRARVRDVLSDEAEQTRLEADLDRKAQRLLDDWAGMSKDPETVLQGYSPWDDATASNKRTLLTPHDEREQGAEHGPRDFEAPSSMRDVEDASPLWVFRPKRFEQSKNVRHEGGR